MPPIDRLLSQYSDPIRSWPGEEDLDAEARSNYAAANPTPRLQRPEEVWRGSVLPIAEMKDKGSPNPSDWRSSGDVLKHLDQGSRWAVPGVIQDVMDAAHAIYDTSGWGLGPATRFSTLPESERQRIAELGLAGATAGVTGGLTRAAVAPRLPGGVTELGIFGGRKARTADLEALARAEEMDAAGVPRESIWSDTGWFKGVDGKWRFEIDDSNISLGDKTKGRLDRVLNHPELFSSYPELGAVRTKPLSGVLGMLAGGGYRPASGLRRWLGSPGDMDYSTAYEGDRRLGKLAHESGHAIEDIEGFASGANPRTAHENLTQQERQALIDADLQRRLTSAEAWNPSRLREGPLRDEFAARYPKEIERAHSRAGEDIGRLAYDANAAEVLQRATESRLRLTPEERRTRPPWLDYDVPESDQIVRFGGEGKQMSMGDSKFDFGPRATSGSRETTIGDTTITYGVNPKTKYAEVALIETPKNKRGQGSARTAMKALVDEADRNGYTLTLTPEPMDKGVSKGRLEKFYKSLGFISNSGRNKDFSTRATMLRPPKVAPLDERAGHHTADDILSAYGKD